MRSLFIASLAASLAVAPVAASAAQQPSTASPLSVQDSRAGADLRHANGLGEMTDGAWVGVAVIIASLVMLAIILLDDEDSDSP